MNSDTVNSENKGQPREKPQRKTRAEKREERKNKDKKKVEKDAKEIPKTKKVSPEKSTNKPSKRENKRIKQRLKRKTDPLKRNYRTKWWLRQERLKNYRRIRHQHRETEYQAEVQEIDLSKVR